MIDNKKLIQKYLKGKLNKKEQILLEDWIKSSEDNLNQFKQEIKSFAAKDHDYFDKTHAYNQFLKETNQLAIPITKSIPIYAYAASITILIALTFWFTIQPKSVYSTNITTPNVVQLKLGSEIIPIDPNTDIQNSKGQMIAQKVGQLYNFSSKPWNNVQAIQQEISVPKGKKIKIQLADGTKVFLNSDSKLIFPSRFQKDQRIVQLIGEAYFEVTKKEQSTFIVRSEQNRIEVLGTEFNVNAYPESKTITTTLIEGSVALYHDASQENKVILIPKKQGVFTKKTNSYTVNDVDILKPTAWMQNRIVLDSLNFTQISKLLERTYNVNITNFHSSLQHEFFKGEFKEESLDHILKTISLSTPFEYQIIGNEVIINP